MRGPVQQPLCHTSGSARSSSTKLHAGHQRRRQQVAGAPHLAVQLLGLAQGAAASSSAQAQAHHPAQQQHHSSSSWQQHYPAAASPPSCCGLPCRRTRRHPRGSPQHTRAAAPAAAAAQQSSSSGAAVADMSTTLSLESIRSTLIRLEDTIIFHFIERAQFARNLPVYTPDAIPVPGFDRQGRRYSLLQYTLRETEQLHGKIRRYTSPDEHPFFADDVPLLVLPPITYPPILAPYAESINLNDEVMRVYLEEVLPGITVEGDDNNHGSASMHDVLCLQALSKRIHYGKFVAEAKFREKPEEYTALIKARDADGIMTLLTDKAVEKKVVERVRLKAATFGQDITGPAPSSSSNGVPNGGAPKLKLSPDVAASIYERWVMPLTKEVEVQYLLRRA